MAENLHRTAATGGFRVDSTEVAAANVDADSNGQFTVDLTQFRRLDSKADVIVQAEDGYVVNPQSVSGITATLEIFESAGSNAEMAEVTSTNDITAINIIARGY